MRRLRLLFSLVSIAFLVTCLLYLGLSSDSDEPTRRSRDSGRSDALFSFRGPGSLFAPSATISLTEDNSTFFAARPAAFGPSLPDSGLSGQIWVGSGFGDEVLGRRGLAAGVEGELGCSDIPGWSYDEWQDQNSMSQDIAKHGVRSSRLHRWTNPQSLADRHPADAASRLTTPDEDRTDDSLHFPPSSSRVSKPTSETPPQEHADIQSLQESAEITGKIVLLSRGGCGFSEKIKWAQRRGANAVIVGDNVRGGPLIRMYAQDDASNITIPSLFTSHTTAHLLSSLIPIGYDIFRPSKPSGSSDWIPKIYPSSAQKPKLNSATHAKKKSKRRDTAELSRPSLKPLRSFTTSSRPQLLHGDQLEGTSTKTTPFWTVPILNNFLSAKTEQSVRAASGKKNNDNFNDGKQSERVQALAFGVYNGLGAPSDRQTAGKSLSHDDFVIGVHDWRDPDISSPKQRPQALAEWSSLAVAGGAKPTTHTGNHLAGGRITPGSGVYENHHRLSEQPDDELGSQSSREHEASVDPQGKRGWLSSLSWSAKEDASEEDLSARTDSLKRPKAHYLFDSNENFAVHETANVEENRREGLWVTLNPTSMDPTPFLNTLFVLVISPLVTLGIVYTMLLIRARIRRRRWRAPKALVERLPVRVYYALSRTSSSTSDAAQEDQVTPSTPLLPESRATDIGQRPRSATVSGTFGSLGSSYRYGSLEPSAAEQEKIEKGLAEWRRRYVGRQIECAVCLEEYVDGVSHVMSLPCGHEFHVDCM